ncbi:MAG: hypothetical protein ABSF60_06225 [Verrucomicrobiota bacterium]
MKFSLPILGLAWLTFLSASAQVTVSVMLDQEQFLPSESLPVAVRITNRSGQPLHLGADTNWLTFSVESMAGAVVVKKADVPVQGEFDVDSSQVATKHVDLTPYYALTREGGYRVTATVRIKAWNTVITSPPQSFNVIDGAKLWSQTFGLPMPDGVTNRAPEVRKYTLEEANYLRSQLRMYVQVSDESETHIFKVRAIGPMVSFSQPEAQLDRLSNLHVIYQSGARIFTYSVISPDGDILQQEIYDYFNTRPRLHTDDDGNITVLGGARRVKPNDTPMVESPAEVPAAPAKP